MNVEQEKKLPDKRFYEDALHFIPSGIAMFDTRQRYLYLNPMP